MVSSPLEWHKAPHTRTNGQQHQTQLEKTKAAAHEATNSRTQQGKTSWQVMYKQHIQEKDKTIKIKKKQRQEPRTCTPETQGISRESTSRPEEDLASRPQNSSQIREGKIKKDVVIRPTAGKISQQATSGQMQESQTIR